MKKFLCVVVILWGFSAHAVYKVGDAPRNTCWTALEVGKACLDDAAKDGHISVLLFSAGWCGPCHNEFKELVPALEKFAGKKVTFISLSAGSFDSSKDPDEAFLQKWSDKYALGKTKAYWIVAASPRNTGFEYFETPSIPSAVLIDAKGKIVWKAVAHGVHAIVKQVEAALKP